MKGGCVRVGVRLVQWISPSKALLLRIPHKECQVQKETCPFFLPGSPVLIGERSSQLRHIVPSLFCDMNELDEL